MTRADPPFVIVVVPADVVDLVSPVQQCTQSTPLVHVNPRPFRLTPSKILVVERVVCSQQMQVVSQLPRPAEVVHVQERIRRCYRLVLSSRCTHHHRKNFVPDTVISSLRLDVGHKNGHVTTPRLTGHQLFTNHFNYGRPME